jgi:hypothetical protein
MYTHEDSGSSARARHEFHAPFEKKIPPTTQNPPASLLQVREQTVKAIQYVSTYLRQQREHYFATTLPLGNQHKASMWPYFSATLLDQVRIVELAGQRVATPSFYAEARALGFNNPPEVTHMDSVTFLDVVVFNEALTERSLFHALVHAVQFYVLGVERYTELFVEQFMRTRTHFTVPLEAQAFSLTSKFMRPSEEKFSVEDQVLRWVADGLY